MNKHEITEMENEIILQAVLELDRNRFREDYYGLYSDIVTELSKKVPNKESLIYDYAAFMETEQRMYSAFEAFQMGALMGYCKNNNNISRNDTFECYIKTLRLRQENVSVIAELNELYNEL